MQSRCRRDSACLEERCRHTGRCARPRRRSGVTAVRPAHRTSPPRPRGADRSRHQQDVCTRCDRSIASAASISARFGGEHPAFTSIVATCPPRSGQKSARTVRLHRMWPPVAPDAATSICGTVRRDERISPRSVAFVGRERSDCGAARGDDSSRRVAPHLGAPVGHRRRRQAHLAEVCRNSGVESGSTAAHLAEMIHLAALRRTSALERDAAEGDERISARCVLVALSVPPSPRSGSTAGSRPRRPRFRPARTGTRGASCS